MYNRYIGNTGKYYRVEDDPRNARGRAARADEGNPQSHHDREAPRDEKPPASFLGGGLKSLLGDGGKFDMGDILLLGLLFFLYTESGDEELLIILIILAAMLFDVGSLFDRFFK